MPETPGSRAAYRAVAGGLTHGVLAWLTFGLFEFLCLSALPAWRESSLLLTPADRVADLAATLAGYGLAGAVLGGVAGGAAALLGRVRHAEPSVAPGRLADLASVTLVGAWIAHLAETRDLSRSAYLGLAVAGLLLAALAVRIVSARAAWQQRTAWLATPAGLSVCLLAPLVARDQLHLSALAQRVGQAAPALKAGAAAGGTLALVVALLAGASLRGRRRSGSLWAPRLWAAAALVLLTLGLGWALDARAIRRLRAGPAVAAPGRARGVLLVSLDAVRADHLSVYGYPCNTSPALATFARHATVYLDARATSDGSLGSHASLFTGKYPSRHGAWVGGDFPFGRPLAAAETTLAERLGEAGWTRFGAVANAYFLNRTYGLSRGFQLFDVPAGDRLELRSRLRTVVPGRGGRVHRSAREVNAVLAVALEAARAGQRPFLALASYMEAHTPYAPDPDFVGRFPGFDPSLPVRFGSFIGAEGARPVFGARESRHLVSLYDSAIASLDRGLGRLFETMRALGLYDETLIIVVADHGEMLGETGVFGHGAGLVEQVLRVPLIVKYPFQREGRRVSAPVSQVDVMPTVLEVLGLPPAPGIDGMSLREAEHAEGRVVLSEAPPERLAHDGRSSSRKRAPAADRPAPIDGATLDRLKSLGYVR